MFTVNLRRERTGFEFSLSKEIPEFFFSESGCLNFFPRRVAYTELPLAPQVINGCPLSIPKVLKYSYVLALYDLIPSHRKVGGEVL